MFFPHKKELSLLERIEKRRRRFAWLFLIVISVLLFFILMLIYIARTYTTYAHDLVSRDRLLNRHFRGLIIYDKNNEVIYESDGAYEVGTVSMSQVPRSLKYATLAAEDSKFYDHPGFSWQGILRSVTLNFQKSNAYAYGGSTITQQLVKNALLDDRSKSYTRKIKELILAVGVDKRYSKDQILEMYLNSSYYGRGAYGVAQASLIYFDKPVDQLNLSESAYLAGLPNAPSTLGGNNDLAVERKNYVLTRMEEERFITTEDKASAGQANPVVAERHLFKGRFPHFSLYVRQKIIAQYGENALDESGYRVYTTLDSALEEFSQKAVTDQVARLQKNNATNGAAVVLDSRTSAIRAMIGSADWNNDAIDGKVNIVLSLQQPGSSFKPLVYDRAIERNLITSATQLPDEPTVFPGNYSPKNYDGHFRGLVTARRALANSLNIPAVEVMEKVGVKDAVNFSRSLGLTSLSDPSQYGLSLVLGGGEVTPLEMTNVYSTFANGGLFNKAYAIEKIVDKYGSVIYSHAAENKRVANENAVYITTSILSDNSARQEIFGSSLNLPSRRPAAVKTGTTDDYRDAWTLGYSPSFTVGVWVGNNDNRAMDSVAGSLGAAPIWIALMEEAHKNIRLEQFNRPPGVLEGEVCELVQRHVVDNGHDKVFYEFKSTREVYIRGTLSSNCADVRRKVEELKTDASRDKAVRLAEVVGAALRKNNRR